MSYTYDEISNQAHAWNDTILATLDQWNRISRAIRLTPGTHVLVIGSGTSLYIAQSAAQCIQEITGHTASAVASSEIFLSPASVIPRDVPVLAFIISRSGTTSEALIATEYLQRERSGIPVVGITCRPDAPLVESVTHAIVLPHADEQSVVMTQSFTSMLLALQVLAAQISGNGRLLDELSSTPDFFRTHRESYEAFGRAVGGNLDARQFIFLGLGPNSGLAEEGTLKLKEMTQTPCEAYNPLEFRHGPISMVERGTTVVSLEGLREGKYLQDVEADVVAHGAEVVSVGPARPSRAIMTLPLPGEFSDVGRCVLYLPAVQYLAYYRALALRLDPDHPRNLTQVVVLRT